MSISPRISLYINIIVALLAAIVGGTISFSGLIPDPVSHAIVAWSSFILSVFGVVNAALHSVSSSSDGPLANVQIKFEKVPSKAVTLFMLLIPALFLAEPATYAYAKVKTHHVKVVKAKQHVLGVIKSVPLKLTQFDPIVELKEPEVMKAPPIEGKTSTTTNALNDLLTKVQSIALADVTYANQLALANNDTIASQCYSAVITFITKQSTGVLGPDGQPLAAPNVHLVTDMERLILLYNALQPTSELSTQCAALINALKLTTVQALLTGFGTGNIAINMLP